MKQTEYEVTYKDLVKNTTTKMTSKNLQEITKIVAKLTEQERQGKVSDIHFKSVKA